MEKKTIIITIVSIVVFTFVSLLIIGNIRVRLHEKKLGITDFHTETSKSAKWAADIPSDVPEFKYGQLDFAGSSIVKQRANWSLIYKGVPPDSVEKYKLDLNNKGWTFKPALQATPIPNSITIISEKNNLKLFMNFNSSKNLFIISILSTNSIAK
jgi:hypothetical protein